jgi:hypothetical protein
VSRYTYRHRRKLSLSTVTRSVSENVETRGGPRCHGMSLATPTVRAGRARAPHGRAGTRQYGRRRPHQSGERDGTGAGSPWLAVRTV